MPRCLNCKSKFTIQRFLQKFCNQSDECTNASIKYAMDKVKSSKVAKSKIETKDLKEKLKTLSDWKKDLQKEINAIISEIDKGHPCIATGTMEGKRNAGHYISTGSNQTLRFHLENIWNQSEHSNMWKSGDTLRYQEGIVKMYGKDYLEYLNSLQSLAPLKITSEEIKEKISICRGIIKWIKLQDRMFTTEERLEFRKQFNEQIGIYK